MPRGILLLALVCLAVALDNGAASRPPFVISTQQMGCDINEELVRREIDAMVSSGLTTIGF